ncbi:MAG: putative addiction module antidote protein, partial [Candidatus Electrothrix sp. AUS1_2]|nr:putative addiction module antidote protein [Candidatus Electrothrix sp. AUS1_2]
MSKKGKVADPPDFDPAKFLQDDEDIAAYLTVVIGENDSSLLAAALGDIARAKGMTETAQATGITREALYKEALRPNAKPRFEMINRVCAAVEDRLNRYRTGLTNARDVPELQSRVALYDYSPTKPNTPHKIGR